MSIFVVVLTGILGYIGYSTYRKQTNNCRVSLEHSLSTPADQNPRKDAPTDQDPQKDVPKDQEPQDNTSNDPGSPQGDQNKPAPKDPSQNDPSRQDPASRDEMHNPAIVLILNISGSEVQVDNRSPQGSLGYSDDQIDKLAAIVRKSEDDYGHIAAYHLQFYKKQTGTDTLQAAFYDVTNIHQTLKGLYISLATAGLVCLLVCYGLSLFLSHLCIVPIERAWKQQQEFVADASHELKTPLTVILANLAILKNHRHETFATNGKYLNYIEEEAGHMSNLVNDLLFLAKNDASLEPASMTRVNLSDILFNAYLSFEAVAYERGLHLDTDIEDDLYLNGIPEKLDRLCAILIDNACKYTQPQGTVTLSLHAKNSHIILTVHNSGAAIPKEHLPHLFERFYRVDEARTRSESGYGLGLSIAASIVRSHHGTIHAESSETEGTSFIVSLRMSS